jgi:hypothetical protein
MAFMASAGALSQHDIGSGNDHYNNVRTMGKGLIPIGEQYQLQTAFILEPTGNLGIFSGAWNNGYPGQLMAYMVPTVATSDGTPGTDYIKVPITYPAGSAGDTCYTRFGYAEFGPPLHFHCTSRAEGCQTDASASPYALSTTDTTTPFSCATAHTDEIPTIKGMTAYAAMCRNGTCAAIHPLDNTTAGPCVTYTANPTTHNSPTSGGTFSITFSGTDQTCNWTASATGMGISVTSGASGTGNGNTTVVVASNSGAARVGTVNYSNGASTVINQAGAPDASAPCIDYALTPSSQSSPAGGSTLTLTVAGTDQTCAWTATASGVGVSITTGASGTGNGSVGVAVAANLGAPREGAISLSNGVSSIISQAGASPVSNSLSLKGTYTIRGTLTVK